MYSKVESKLDFVANEKKISQFWKENNIVKKALTQNANSDKYFVLHDGPPTANGKPHIGHVLTRAMKDVIPRFKAMKGYYIFRKAGWDTHGLPVEVEVEKEPIKNKFLLCLGLTSLILTTIFLIISNLINVEMYLITLIFALVDLIIGSIYCFIKKEDKIYILKPVKTLPYEFIPFLISMFIIISSLNQTDLLLQIGNLLNSIESVEAEVFAYGLTSAISANLVNNVPMSLLYANILNANTLTTVDNVYAAILASNLCALITPCGALSSLMFMRICKENEVKISYLDYMKFAPLGIVLLVIGIELIIVF